MRLTFTERFVLQTVLPAQGDFITMRKLKELIDALILTDEELERFEVKTDTEMIQWSEAGKSYEAEIAIGEIAEKEIVTALKKLNDERKLEAKHLSLYEKFVEKAGHTESEVSKTETVATPPLTQ